MIIGCHGDEDNKLFGQSLCFNALCFGNITGCEGVSFHGNRITFLFVFVMSIGRYGDENNKPKSYSAHDVL